jgi:hypothetical protein
MHAERGLPRTSDVIFKEMSGAQSKPQKANPDKTKSTTEESDPASEEEIVDIPRQE